jgi:hypothetical protein
MMTALHHMFVLGAPVAEKVLRPIVVYGFLIIGLRPPASVSSRN